jgi:mRNA interferase RelE/StbE
MYAVRMLKAASRELERLDKPVARRILERIHWLAENIEHIKPLPLKGALSDLYKLREGDYRILYEIVRPEKIIIIHALGHRREVYED